MEQEKWLAEYIYVLEIADDVSAETTYFWSLHHLKMFSEKQYGLLDWVEV